MTLRTTVVSIIRPQSAWSFQEEWVILLELCSWQFLWFNSQFYNQLAYPSYGKFSAHMLIIFWWLYEEADAIWFFVEVCAETQGILLPYRIRDRKGKGGLFEGESNGVVLVSHLNDIIILHLLEIRPKDIIFWLVDMRPGISLGRD